ncbi:arylsulfatase A-like enzyme [Roseimicrobium gellanilyticum]|uniref:Arylsulfatase A-like enzyme n=1 Tax=Roseimicrobium gellanilyticum TaxID=748857 RepID=A0A366H8U9_9BACT|nr:arylsulfatase [Roseimicrobium gellanilyticum]RBP38658.1 arylsulfatase A-like enzyme [Roseimicrobium gellanilyticum]
MRFRKLFSLLAIAITFTVGEAARAASSLPNIVVILSDDFGYGSTNAYGADPKLVQTPNMDRLAKEGRRFTDANTTSSVCSPTRYSLLTGRYCWRTTEKHGVLSTFSPLHIESSRLNMASLLKKHGYTTAAVGKWHLGYGKATENPNWRTDYTAELSPGPLDIGFDYHFGVPANHGDLTGVFVENRFVYGLRSGNFPKGIKIPGPGADEEQNFQSTYGPEDTEVGRGNILPLDAPRRKNERVMAQLTLKATRWIEQQPKDKPFFLYFTPVAAHNPITPDKDLAGKSPAGSYGDWIHELDRSVGGILEALEKKGVAQNTLVLFTSDNGGVVKTDDDTPQSQAYKAGLKVNGALRGRKHDVWEGGFKVPFMVRWPGQVQAGSVSHDMISVADILATTAEIIGEPLPSADKAAEDSRSFLAALKGHAKSPVRDDMIVHSSDGVYAIRKGPWKWVEGVPAEGIKLAARKKNGSQFRPQLFNTKDDPAEEKDVSAAHPEVVEELRVLLVRYRDGGYSRELPPVVTKQTEKIATMDKAAGGVVLEATLQEVPGAPWVARKDNWTARDGGLWGSQLAKDKNGAVMRVPASLTDGVIDYEISFDGADRHSLRIEWGDKKGSFRVEVSPEMVGLTKNPSAGEAKDAIERIARKPVKLAQKTWYPVRITFKGDKATVQVNDVTIEGTHAVLGESKNALNFLVFESSAGFRNVRVTR